MLVFLWWAGAGLSALVNIFYELGFKDIVVVDKYQSEITDKLSKKWIKVIIWDGIYNFSDDDIIIYSDAVVSSQDFQKVKNNRKFTYFQFVWEISKRFQTISIAGTHGKTSTTSILISSLKKLNFDKFWLWIVGGFVADLDNKNYYINPKHKDNIKTIFEKILTPKWARPAELFKELYFVIEADEFNKHFLLLDTYIWAITKVDHDHKDVYPTEKDYFETFEDFVNKTRYKIFTNDEELNNKLENINKKIELVDLSKSIELKYAFGEHMRKNTLLVKKVIEEVMEITDNSEIIKAISSFKWVWRRQEYLGDLENISIYTDYAHHPVEIEATYKSFKENFPGKEIIWVFQPHQLFRFVSYEKDFIESLKKFDEIYIYDIYSVREDNLLQELTWLELPKEEQKKIIWEKIANKVWWKYIEEFDNLIKKLENKKWIAIFMTAWDLDYKIRNYIKN